MDKLESSSRGPSTAVTKSFLCDCLATSSKPMSGVRWRRQRRTLGSMFLLVVLLIPASVVAAADRNEATVDTRLPPAKAGRCPPLIDSRPEYCSTNQSACDSDLSCPGSTKCCSDGCVNVCVEPLYSACEHQRAATSTRARALGNELSVRQPRCRSDGAFEPVQCDNDETGQCWCVDKSGFEEAGTRAKSRDAVNCSLTRPCSGLMCRMLCPYDFELDTDGCPLCQCRDPCSGVVCPGNQQCHLEDVVCDAEPCPPVPSCKQARVLLDSICPTGNPLYMSAETKQPFLCGIEPNKPQCPPFFSCVVQSNLEYGACCPTLDQINKPGKCPDSSSNYTECGDDCGSDADCMGLLKCCQSDKCQNHCVASNSTACEQQKVLAELLSRNEKEDRGYVPECTETGEFKSLQCSRNGLVCWCVDQKGNKLPKTMGPAEKVSCTGDVHVLSSAACDEVICHAFCEYGFKLDEDNCQTCDCADPCDGFSCPEGFRCTTSKNKTCIESFCPSLPTCEPISQRIKNKPGVCPPVEQQQCLNESTVACSQDDECAGDERCCPHQCGTTCMDTVELANRLPTMCEYLRAYALSVGDAPNKPILAYPVPQCTKDGLYEPVQCAADGQCWCVDEFGSELRNTRTSSRDNIDCRTAQSRITCLGLMCRLGCDYGFVRDESGCQICECRNPCENMICPDGLSCQLVEVETSCSGGFCPPVPQCISTSKSSLTFCPVGEPLVDPTTNETLICGFGDRPCPDSHFCLTEEEATSGMCCTKITGNVCEMPKDAGSCSGNEERWFYNGDTTRCESFVFGGCDGNTNNFATFEDCEKMCVVNRGELPKMGECPVVSADEVGTCAEECTHDSDCPGPQKCCLNGCGAHVCRDPAGSLGKPGQCPFLVPINTDTCEFQCKSDYDCSVDFKCCSNGCGTTCVEPEMKTACEHQKSVAEHKAREAGIPAAQLFIPKCRDEDGSFAQIQCLVANQTCWCVNESGREVIGTRSFQGLMPNCDAPTRCEPLHCITVCEHGVQLDYEGCPTCTCLDPCEGTVCDRNEECRLVQVQCITSPCPPIPMCLPKLDNPCSSGEPLRDVVTQNLLKCGPQGIQCPSTHKCHLSPLGEFAICCPKPRDICVQPQEAGRCLAAIPRWYFDPLRNSCEEFLYGGCGGNLNNFQTREDCKKVCPVLSSCEQVREKNLKMMSTYKKDMFIPHCNRVSGAWDPVQCLPSLGLCWCVSRDGEQQPGTLVRGVPQCSARTGRKFSYANTTICGSNETVHVCSPEVCEGKVCLAHPDAVCRVDPCGGCTARFFNETDGEAVDCNDGLSPCQQELQTVLNSKAWSNQGGQLPVNSLEDLLESGALLGPGPVLAASSADDHSVKKRDIVESALSMLRSLVPSSPSGMARSVVTTFFQPELIKPGLCPLPQIRSLLRDLFLRSDECSMNCFLDSDCPHEQKCCMTGCGMTCTDPATPTWLMKRGQCPADSGEDVSPIDCLLVQQCQFDMDCSGNEKCCHTSCGSACVDAEDTEADEHEDGSIESQPSEKFGVFTEPTTTTTTTPSTTTTIATTTTTEAPPAPVHMGVVLPQCLANGNYVPMQTQGSLSWCVTSDGNPIHESLSRGSIQCASDGEVLAHTESPPVCLNKMKPYVCKDECLHAYCPSHPNAVCTSDPCNYCKVTFVNIEGEQVNCEDTCTQPLEVGICRASFPRWYFNDTSETCEEFIFGGCRGNDNNFETFEDCSRECSRPLDACRQPKRTGMCRASMHRWYYNELTHKCQEFIYGGCDGNENNFETQEECEARCPDLVLCSHLDVHGDLTPCSRRRVCDRLKCPGKEDVVCTVDACNNCSAVFVDLDGIRVTCQVEITAPRTEAPSTPPMASTTEEPNEIADPGIMKPVKKTRCQKLRLWAIAHEEHIPRCDKLGRFEPMQCDQRHMPNLEMLCWCVDEAGNQVDGLPHFKQGAQTCKRLGVEKVDVNLAFAGKDKEISSPDSVKKAIKELLDREDADTSEDVIVEVQPEVILVKFVLVGDNKVDVAYSLEERIRSGQLALVVDGKHLPAMHSASTFRHELSNFHDDYERYELSSDSIAVIIIFTLLSMVLICTLIGGVVMYRRKRMGSYPKGSMESLANSTSPLYSSDTKAPLPTSPELHNFDNHMLDKKFDISTIEHEYAIITTPSAKKRDPPV